MRQTLSVLDGGDSGTSVQQRDGPPGKDGTVMDDFTGSRDFRVESQVYSLYGVGGGRVRVTLSSVELIS